MPPTLRAYLRFLLEQPRLLTFGFALTLFSSFGQTYFIALFNDDIRADFDLSHGEFGLVYSLATLASGLSIIWIGGMVDRFDLRSFTLITMSGMVAGSFLLGFSPTLLTLALGIYLLRLCGQGLYGHISMTSMARYFDRNRGKSISIASAGYPAGEAVFPLLGVALIAAFGWRNSWFILAAGIALVVMPLIMFLLRGHSERVRAYHEALRNRHAPDSESPGPASPTSRTDSMRSPGSMRQWRRREVIRDRRFHLLLPAVLGPAFMVTGMFFHQLRLVEERGWEVQTFAAGFIVFAAVQVPAGLLTGILIDRVGSLRLVPLLLMPIMLGMLTITITPHPLAIPVFFMFFGLTSGAVGPILTATWAEMYGVEHLGSIRALTTAFMVISTSLSPVLLGVMLDQAITMTTIAQLFVVYCLAASVCAGIATRVSPTGMRDRRN